MKQRILTATILLLSGAALVGYLRVKQQAPVGGSETLPLPETVDYNFHIKPILSDNCYTCHGPDANKRKAGLRLDIAEGALAELPENPGQFAIVPGKPARSLLHSRIHSRDENLIMPPPDSKLALTWREKKLLERWIEQGAEFERHWAFIPPVKAPVPTPSNADFIQNEIDGFVLRKLEEHGLEPSPRAEATTLYRRISMDLTGLPPVWENLRVSDVPPGQAAISEFIDSLMALPAYGERMTQNWLDVARYADSHGYQDDSYRSMWPWRDWVIHAFNSNMPYDEFLTWQLAGDLLPGAGKEQVLATGFNRNHPITQEGGVIQEEYQSAYVVDRTNTFGKAVLGVTLECAKCHDHKYDAISQKEYYQVYAFFNNVDEKGLQMDAVQAANNQFFADPPFVTITARDTDSLLAFVNMRNSGSVNVMVMNDSLPRQTHVLNRGNYDEPGEEVFPGTPVQILPFPESFPKDRLGLARWTTDPANPLTSRVFVNRIWAMLFGQGLVRTPEDFGVQGSLPSHPQLLDWLAADFVENGWDIRHLLKKIMLSATYQQQSRLTPELQKADPENLLLARAGRFRMSGEMIRDYILATSGLLNREIGGPSVKPYQPAGLWEETNAGGNRGILTKYEADTGDNLYRRSLYTFWKRTLPPPNMTIFDAPTRDFSEVRRQNTNTPLQALALQNDIQVLEASRVLAQRIVSGGLPEPEWVDAVFRTILIRPPGPEESRRLAQFYEHARSRYRLSPEDADPLLQVGAYQQPPTDKARTVALMLTAQVVYNLAETITRE